MLSSSSTNLISTLAHNILLLVLYQEGHFIALISSRVLTRPRRSIGVRQDRITRAEHRLWNAEGRCGMYQAHIQAPGGARTNKEVAAACNHPPLSSVAMTRASVKARRDDA